jgi:hypothetical protein
MIIVVVVFFVAPVFSAHISCQNLFVSDPIKHLSQQSMLRYQKHILGSSLYEPLTLNQAKYLEKMLDFSSSSESTDNQLLRMREWEDLYISERHAEDALGLLYDPYWRRVRDIVFLKWASEGMGEEILKFFEVIPPSLNQIYLVRKNMGFKGPSSAEVGGKSKWLQREALRTWLLETEMFVRLDLEYQLMDEGASHPEWPQFISYLVEHIRMKDIDTSDCQSMLKKLTMRLRPIQYQLPEVRSALIEGMFDIFQLLERKDLKKMERLSLEKFLSDWISSLPAGSLQMTISPLEILKKSANLDQDLMSRIEKLQTWNFQDKKK